MIQAGSVWMQSYPNGCQGFAVTHAEKSLLVSGVIFPVYSHVPSTEKYILRNCCAFCHWGHHRDMMSAIQNF